MIWILRKWIDTRAAAFPVLQGRRARGRRIQPKRVGETAVLRQGRVSCLIAPGVALLLALFGLLPALWMNHGVEAGVKAQANQIYVFERFNHHLDPAKFWADGFVPPFLCIVGLWLLLWRSVSDAPGARRLWGFTATAVIIALIGAAIALPGLCDRATGRRLDAVLLVSAG